MGSPRSIWVLRSPKIEVQLLVTVIDSTEVVATDALICAVMALKILDTVLPATAV